MFLNNKNENLLPQKLYITEVYDFKPERGLEPDCFMSHFDERYKLVIKEWAEVKTRIQKGLMEELTSDNHIFMMSDSGARGNASNFTQLAGIRGSMANTKREGLNKAYNIKAGIKSTIELPVKSSFIEGLTMSEFFKSLTTLLGVPINAGCLKRFPPKSNLVPIFLSFNFFTKSFLEIGEPSLTVIANPNQDGSL